MSKRIQNMDISKIPTREDLVDVIVMLSMRPAEAGKLRDSIYTESGICNAWLFNEFLKQEPYRTIPGKLRDYGVKHASRIHGGKKATSQHLKLLSRIAMRQESDRLDAGNNYAIDNIESEDSGPEDDCNSEPESESAENDEISEIINMYSSLNYLRNQEISTIPSRIPKLNPCSICQKAILTFRFQSFIVLDCEHIFHRQCLEKHIIRAEMKYPSCPSCPITIELISEEAVLASGEYLIQKKQTDTGQDDEELMASLGLVEGGSRAGQGSQSKQVTMQDQATSPIMRMTMITGLILLIITGITPMCKKVNLNQEEIHQEDGPLQGSLVNKKKFQALLQELSTPKGEKAEHVDEEEDADGSVSQSLARLYQKATRAGLRITKANQDEILCWYKYAEGFENRVREIRSQDSSVTDPTARSRAYREVSQHLPGITEANLLFVPFVWFYFLSTITKQTPKRKLCNMSTASSADESDASRYSLSYVSKKRKGSKVESASAPKRRSQRIASQNSDLTVATSQLRLSSSLSSSYDLSNLVVSDTSVNMVSNVNTDTNMDINVETNTDTDTNMEKEANEMEKEWWAGEGSLGSLDIDEKRLPLILARDVKYNNFITRVKKIKARSRQFLSAFNNATPQDDVEDWGAKSLFTNLPTNQYEEPDACFVPRRLLTQNPALNPCDRNGNPWPTIIFEVASSETLSHVRRKINDYWLRPNRCEDVIVIKIGNWRTRRRSLNGTTRRPLRRLRCLKFCRAETLRQNPNATTFDPIEEIEFGSVFANGRESYFCTGPHMKWLTIDCDCIFNGCPQPLPSFYHIASSRPFRIPQFPYPLVNPGVAIDLFDLQEAIFNAMGPN
ncbi:hypothetical protein GLOIN_2v1469914 [Rhizophagus clarus]|uniref:RING-type domain-containing protein n=1 Tax=Rhizophagus clarus TaxID=94130 RepID=A0A8H3QL67_9GLOM|nr:hypothetical protein GLOIN_2v1469914 [Rhizophagus clarus]